MDASTSSPAPARRQDGEDSDDSNGGDADGANGVPFNLTRYSLPIDYSTGSGAARILASDSKFPMALQKNYTIDAFMELAGDGTNFTLLTAFLNEPDVVEKGYPHTDCNDTTNSVQWRKLLFKYIPSLLRAYPKCLD